MNASYSSADSLRDRIAAARDDIRADLLLQNARLLNVLTGEIEFTDMLVHGGYVVGLGSGLYTDARQIIDVGGRYVAPGFIDAHVHIESSLVTPPEFARAVLVHGVTSVVTDPHEIANVLGMDGIRFMLDRANDAPINLYVMASSCVPATHMETSGARLEADDLALLIDDSRVIGLAEMMNYPGVVHGDADVLTKIQQFAAYPLDGHAPALTGKALNAYVAAGIGSDHECTTVEEAQEKLRLGMMLLIREGTTTRNLEPLLPVVTPNNHHRICFCTDDRQPGTLLDEGSIDGMIRTAIASGIDPMIAIRMATINTANWFRLMDRGAVVPGRRADMVVFSDLQDLRAEMVFLNGVLSAQEGRMIVQTESTYSVNVRPSMNVRPGVLDFSIVAHAGRMRVIDAYTDQVVTGHRIADVIRDENGYAVCDLAHDILKIAVIERHTGSGGIAKAFIHGFGLKRGALAGSVAHDHHNIVVIGADDVSMARAVHAIIEMGGGLAAADGDQIAASLALPVAGLMSEAPLETVRTAYDTLIASAHAMGSTLPDPLMTMSFMALEVIPKLKLTDLGLVDVETFSVVDLFV